MLVTDLGLHAGYKPTLSALHGWMLLPLSHKAHTSQLSHIYVTLAFRTLSEGFMLLNDLLCLLCRHGWSLLPSRKACTSQI